MGTLGSATVRPYPGTASGTIAEAVAHCDALLEVLRTHAETEGRRVLPQDLLDDLAHAFAQEAARGLSIPDTRKRL